MSGIQERRRFKRIESELDVLFSPNSDFIQEWSCRTKDLSENGLKVVSIREPVLGTNVEVMITLPNAEGPILLESEVMWSRPMPRARGHFEVGIQFVGTTDAKKEFIRDFVNNRIALAY